jgi:hypothetical protein
MNKAIKNILVGKNISYIGSTSASQKVVKSEKKGTLTYIIYLAPATMARDDQHKNINVCPVSATCREFCLNESGHNKLDILSHGRKESRITRARINRTHLFYENRSNFVAVVSEEIKAAERKANRMGLNFAVRLNGTSDLNPILFKNNEGKNLLEAFPHVQFYDYTKVVNRLTVADRYNNYDITFSYNGENWHDCKEALKKNRVAVVFDMDKLPATYRGYKVINGDESDIRHNDPTGVIVGLKYKKVAGDYINGRYERKKSDFVIDCDNYIK